ncbi:hypothetical protein L484_014134 [Morus notabilis]|uniref:Nucleolar complex protein 2-like protein n=1 Tax=Morus notabilis TaxID=981085 RepID=W9RZM7_9ROSA|nr:hypothetical protein L484_014134 [Morus notabilis]
MGKLGKRARKFAKKNLQSVLKRKRQLKSMFKKKASKKNEQDDIEEQEEDIGVLPKNEQDDIEEQEDIGVLPNVRDKGQDLVNFSLDAVFTDDDSDADDDDSDSDEYLPEDSSLDVPQSDSENYLEDNSRASALSSQNREIYLELAKKRKKLDRSKQKDPKFSKFLEIYDKELKSLRNKEAYSDEDDMSVDETQSMNENTQNNEGKFLTSSAVDYLCQLVSEKQSLSALTSLLNGYWAVCHYGVESSLNNDSHRFPSSEAFSKILMFMLNEADDIFRKLLGLSSNFRKEKLSELKNSSKWDTVKPLIKSYLRSTLFLLNQVTETEILAFSLARVRASTMFFVAFPSLLRRLIKAALQLWATGGDSVSTHAFLIILELASVCNSDWFDTCFIKTYKSFIGHCQFVEQPVQLKHVQYLRDSFVKLCSLDVQKSSKKAMVSIQQLAKILHQGLQTKKKEAVKNICSWQYINCVDLWVSFISANICDYDLQTSVFMVIQIINGMALLFPGPRYLPLRVKCIQWLNQLSSSSGIFIPVVSLILDVLEYKSGDGGKYGKAFSLSTVVKLPKHCLKSRNFQEQCILSAIELLSTHFAQWSHHISFPELSTIPLIRLRKFHEITTIESFKRVVKRFVDQLSVVLKEQMAYR